MYTFELTKEATYRSQEEIETAEHILCKCEDLSRLWFLEVGVKTLTANGKELL